MRRTLVLSCLLPVLGALVAVAPASANAVGAPRPTCHGKVATIVGTDQSDKIVGTAGPDVIVAGRGEDDIDGRGGDDVICGEESRDTIIGGTGNDVLDGGGDHFFFTKYGGSVHGDVLVPGPGDDEIWPGFDKGQRRVGQLADTIVFRGAHGVRVKLGDPGSWGSATGEGRDRILGQPIIAVDGTDHDDVLVGAASQDTFFGNGGADRLLGGAGDDDLNDGNRDRPDNTDFLDGGPGDDLVSSFKGPDQLAGGSGDDRLDSRAGSCATHDGGAGHDALSISGGSGAVTFDAGATSGTADQTPCGSATAYEELDLDAYEGPVNYRGTDGPDTVDASGDGPVTATMLGGDDTIVTSGGDDIIDAGDGIDTVDASDGLDVCANAETASSCESETSPVVPSCENRVATIVADQEPSEEPKVITGTPGDDVIFGSDTADVIDGGAGNDVICGRGGTDELTGGEGDDRLFGGLDGIDRQIIEYAVFVGDTLVPGPGDDHLDGGWDARQGPRQTQGTTDHLDLSSATSGITADLTAGTITGQGSDTVVALPRQHVTATSFADRITGSAGGEIISAGDGADVVDGAAGNDTINLDGAGPAATDTAAGGDGNDGISTTGGSDVITSGEGNDETSAAKSAGAVSIDAGPGDDSVFAHSGALLLDGGEGNDALSFTGGHVRGPVTVKAGAGTLLDRGRVALSLPGWERYSFSTPRVPWRFIGTSLDESFAAYGASRVVALGRGGDDVLQGTKGRDRLVGGAGRDKAIGDEGLDTCVGVEDPRDCERTR